MAITFTQQPVAQNVSTGENWTLGANTVLKEPQFGLTTTTGTGSITADRLLCSSFQTYIQHGTYTPIINEKIQMSFVLDISTYTGATNVSEIPVRIGKSGAIGTFISVNKSTTGFDVMLYNGLSTQLKWMTFPNGTWEGEKLYVTVSLKLTTSPDTSGYTTCLWVISATIKGVKQEYTGTSTFTKIFSNGVFIIDFNNWKMVSAELSEVLIYSTTYFKLYKTPSTLINSSTETDGTYSYTDVADVSDVGDYYITATNAGTTITSDTVSVTLKSRRRIIIT